MLSHFGGSFCIACQDHTNPTILSWNHQYGSKHLLTGSLLLLLVYLIVIMKSLAFLYPKPQHHGSSLSLEKEERAVGGASLLCRVLFGQKKRQRQKQDSSSSCCTLCTLSSSILKIKTQKASLQATYWTDVAIAAAAAACEVTSRQRAVVVGFDKVDILYMDTVLDRNPAVSEGPPIALGWKNLHSECGIDLEEYESGKTLRPRKMRAQMRLNCEEREQILLATGTVTTQDIDIVMEQVMYDKWQREVIRRSAPVKDKRKYNKQA
jgi:hypothetical protein